MNLRRHPMLDPRGRGPEATLILPRLLVGEYPRPEDVPDLRTRHGVTAVLSLQDDDDLAIKGIRIAELLDAYAEQSIEVRRVPITDNDAESVALRLETAVQTLEELYAAGHTVLLHCNAGYNRAPTVAIAWLHCRRGMPLGTAHEHVRTRRPCVPFMSLLRERFA